MKDRVSRRRSIVKAIIYRSVIVSLDFLVIYLLTGKLRTATGFMLIINAYTTAAYFLHERVWSGIRRGTQLDTRTS